jgi:hypothetical protein
MDRFREERGGIAVILTERLRDREHLDPESLAQHLLVPTRLDLVSREAGGVVDEHAVEAALGRVRHQTLKLWPPVRSLPPGVEIAVLADEREAVLRGEGADRFPLRIGREPLALLLGGLANVSDGSRRCFRRHVFRPLLSQRAQDRA